MSGPDQLQPQVRLRTGTVVEVAEQTCRVVIGDETVTVRFAADFPTPRVERVSPGHLVAIAGLPGRTDAVIWRWYDAVVLGGEGGGVRPWEPAHGEVLATARSSTHHFPPGSPAYLSAGLPGADWWVAGAADANGAGADVELDQLAQLYADHDMWDTV